MEAWPRFYTPGTLDGQIDQMFNEVEPADEFGAEDMLHGPIMR